MTIKGWRIRTKSALFKFHIRNESRRESTMNWRLISCMTMELYSRNVTSRLVGWSPELSNTAASSLVSTRTMTLNENASAHTVLVNEVSPAMPIVSLLLDYNYIICATQHVHDQSCTKRAEYIVITSPQIHSLHTVKLRFYACWERLKTYYFPQKSKKTSRNVVNSRPLGRIFFK